MAGRRGRGHCGQKDRSAPAAQRRPGMTPARVLRAVAEPEAGCRSSLQALRAHSPHLETQDEAEADERTKAGTVAEEETKDG